MSNPAKKAHDWAHILPEILEVIVKKITSLADYIRFRAVCPPWRLTTPSLRDHHLPLQQLPWLMLPYLRSDDNGDSTRLFYDLSARKIHRLDLPRTRGRGVHICGSSHGWFVLQKGQEVFLLNPITKETISLPPFRGSPFCLGIAPVDESDDEDFFCRKLEQDLYSIKPTDDARIYKAVLTSSPRDPSCKIFVLTRSVWMLAFCRIQDELWTVIEFEPNYPRGACDISDITWRDGFLYGVNPAARVTRYDVAYPTRTQLGGYIADLGDYHLVEGVSGDILLIGDQHIIGDDADLIDTKHTVYKLSNEGEPEWIPVIDVGQNVLFKGRFAWSLSSANLQLPEWGANCLCYHSQRRDWDRQDSWYNHYIKLARLDNGTVTDITGDLGPFNVMGRAGSIWLTPTLL